MKHLRSSIAMLAVMTLLTGIVYPFTMTGIGRLIFPSRSAGSLLVLHGRVVGSRLIGQAFTGPGYFHGRPSAGGYDGLNSGGSNLGPTSRKMIDAASGRALQVRRENDLPADAKIPADLILASGSGLDPHVSADAAMLQARRVARERNMDLAAVTGLVHAKINRPYFGITGAAYVNVLELNLALDTRGNGK